MHTLLIILSPVYLLLMLPFVWVIESLKVLTEMIYEYADFFTHHYIPAIKEMFRRTNK